MRRKIPAAKNVSNVLAFGFNLKDKFAFFIQPNDETNSAEPKTAGITVEKLRVASSAYSISVKYSLPTYCQLFK